MASILKGTPKVLLVQETCMQAGQDKVRGIFNYVHLFGPWHLHLIQGREGENRLRLRQAWRTYDGIIAGQMMLGLETELRRTRKSLVLMDPLEEFLRPESPFARLCRTQDDSAAVGQAGAAYFLEKGHRCFAYVGEPLNRNWSIQRGEGFSRRIAEAGFDCHVYSVPSHAESDGSEEDRRLAAWLRRLPRPVAVLAAMDSRALQVIGLCAEAGLRVPEDVAVLGIDNDELVCNGSIPTLSSIRRDTESCGFMAARMLDRLMRKQNSQQEVRHYGVREIVTRDSTRPGAVDADALAQRAREFIRINAGEGIGVPDVSEHLIVSRRLLEIRFRAAYGHSLLEEIQAVRLERVEKLLKETDLPMTEVCTRSGYQTDVHLRRVFKKHFGLSMSDYRHRLRYDR